MEGRCRQIAPGGGLVARRVCSSHQSNDPTRPPRMLTAIILLTRTSLFKEASCSSLHLSQHTSLFLHAVTIFGINSPPPIIPPFLAPSLPPELHRQIYTTPSTTTKPPTPQNLPPYILRLTTPQSSAHPTTHITATNPPLTSPRPTLSPSTPTHAASSPHQILPATSSINPRPASYNSHRLPYPPPYGHRPPVCVRISNGKDVTWGSVRCWATYRSYNGSRRGVKGGGRNMGLAASKLTESKQDIEYYLNRS